MPVCNSKFHPKKDTFQHTVVCYLPKVAKLRVSKKVTTAKVRVPLLPSSRACDSQRRCRSALPRPAARTSMTSWLEASEPEITSLQFADSFSDTSVKLFEMDDKVLEELLADGGRRA